MSLKNRTIRNRIAAGSIAALAALSLAACSNGGGGGGEAAGGGEDCTPAHEFETIEPGVLTVASYDYPPYTTIDGNSVTGIDGDILTEFAERNCLELNVTSAGGAGAVIPSIETGRADIGSGAWYRTSERAEIIRLTEPHTIDAGAIVSTTGLTSDELEGKRIGSVSGNLWNDSLQQWLGDDFVIYQDDESIYGDLEAGRIDGIVASAASAVTRFDSNPIEGAEVVNVTPNENVPEFENAGQVFLPVSLENEELGTAVDETIVELRESGFIADLLEKYNLDPEAANITETWEL